MKKAFVITLAAVSALAVAARPAMGQSAAAKPSAQDVGINAARDNWKSTIAYITAAAEELTDADYSYRPVPTVRTFAGLIGHIAGSQNMYCAMALGDKEPSEDDIEKTETTKAALVKALKASNDYCAKAYGISAASSTASVDLFGQRSTRFGALLQNATHNGEHYGNIVTYMRMKGMVPPSSKR
ncbi:MAG: DinB family protein [Gemmatimonadaceae bacterium]